jgi:hypothetical protein
LIFQRWKKSAPMISSSVNLGTMMNTQGKRYPFNSTKLTSSSST